MFQIMLERLFLVGLFLKQQSWAIMNWIYGIVLTSNMKMVTIEYLEKGRMQILGTSNPTKLHLIFKCTFHNIPSKDPQVGIEQT